MSMDFLLCSKVSSRVEDCVEKKVFEIVLRDNRNNASNSSNNNNGNNKGNDGIERNKRFLLK